jgi:hypothetical protein
MWSPAAGGLGFAHHEEWDADTVGYECPRRADADHADLPAKLRGQLKSRKSAWGLMVAGGIWSHGRNGMRLGIVTVKETCGLTAMWRAFQESRPVTMYTCRSRTV